MARIIVIDNDKNILQIIKKCFENEGYSVAAYEDAKDVRIEQLNQFDLMLLDVMMPGIDGFEFCKQIRSLADFPIIFLTARIMSDDILYGLDIGADDYITKPFRVAELRARVEAHLRREKRNHTQKLAFNGYYFDLSAKCVIVGDSVIKLTKNEYLICEYLAKHRGRVFSKEQIYVSAIDFCGDSDDSTIATHIKNIRFKFKQHLLAPISTVWGIGYKWE